MDEFERASYNLISAIEAKEISEVGHKKYLYYEYMKNLNEIIRKSTEVYGKDYFFSLAPNPLIADKVIKDIEAKGYKVKVIVGSRISDPDTLLITIPEVKDDIDE